MYSYRGYNLPFDLFLLAAVFLKLLHITLLLRLFPPGRILPPGKGNPKGCGEARQPGEAEQVLIDKIYRAATFYLRHLWRTEKPCLRRTLLLYHWCRRLNIPARMLIGVKKTGDELQSHAWLEINSNPVGDEPEDLKKYTIILER